MKRSDPNATEFELFGDSKGSCSESYVNIEKIAVQNLQVRFASLKPWTSEDVL